MDTAEIKGTANDTISILVNENNILNFVENEYLPSVFYRWIVW